MVDDPDRWKLLLLSERLYRIGARLTEGDEEGGEAIRRWYGVVAELFHGCAEASRLGWLDVPPPTQLFKIFGDFADEMASGRLPEEFEAARIKGKGRKKRGKKAARHVGWATLYIRQAMAGKIYDDRPRDTIHKAYGVSLDTVDTWATLDLPKACSGDFDTEFVIMNMEYAGKNWRRFGPSWGLDKLPGGADPVEATSKLEAHRKARDARHAVAEVLQEKQSTARRVQEKQNMERIWERDSALWAKDDPK